MPDQYPVKKIAIIILLLLHCVVLVGGHCATDTSRRAAEDAEAINQKENSASLAALRETSWKTVECGQSAPN